MASMSYDMGAWSSVKNEKAAKTWTMILTVLTVGLVVIFFRKPPETRIAEPTAAVEREESLVLRHTVPASPLAGSQPNPTAPFLPNASAPPPATVDRSALSERSLGAAVARPSWDSPRDLRLPPTSPPAQEPVGGHTAPSYHRIVDGDSLAGLAEKYLGSRERAEEIFAANRDVLPGREVLPLGVRLIIPPRLAPVPLAPPPVADEPRGSISASSPTPIPDSSPAWSSEGILEPPAAGAVRDPAPLEDPPGVHWTPVPKR